MGGILESFSARSVIQGAPLFIETDNGIKAFKILMNHYNKIVKKKVLYTQIRTMWNTSNILNFLNGMDYKYEEHLNFLVDLNVPIEMLSGQLFKSRRNGINRAKRHGVTIEEVADVNSIPIVYNLLQETYKNAKVPLANISLFESAFNILTPKNMAKFFLAKHEGECIGTVLVLIHGKAIHNWYAGASREHLKLCPNDLLTWHAIEWGSKNGYTIFDFGGAGIPKEEYGVREFKRQFGGRLVNFGRYTKIHSPLKMKIAEKGFKVYRMIK